MAKHVKKTDQNKAWNRRTGNARAYDLESRAANAKRFLIICEGVNTEPCYFKSFPVQTAQVEAFGIGRSKTSLVEHAIEWVQQKPPDSEREVWVVFDMDFDPSEDATLQRNDFNEAIRLAKDNRFRVAYSNDAFELWFVLHYQFLEAALDRAAYYNLLGNHWGMSYERDCKGLQFCRAIYQRLLSDPNADQQAAIRHAERLFAQHAGYLPAVQNPCTTVFQLVVELNKYLKK
ncbi:MAG: RloB domain-containing protein [Saprospiraceae bacterium]|jgi:hypothetical protein|nr:RloB domain-containing protein [Saprospiraceae bacterium]